MVVCAQLGARDHYVFPRMLHQAGLLEVLVTDFWSPQGPLPRQFQPGRMKGRQHSDLRRARIRAPNLRTLLQEFCLRLLGKQEWDRIIARNCFFQRTALKLVPWTRSGAATNSASQPGTGRPALFAYSYAALALLARAKSLGWMTILGQINPGPVEVELVAGEAARWPEFGPERPQAPAHYWKRWREEIDLADHVVVNSTWSKSALLKAGVPEEKLQLVPLPFEAQEASGQAAKLYPNQFSCARPLRVLYLGQVNHRKGAPALLAALDTLADCPVELWMVGPVRLSIPARYRGDPRIRWVGRRQRAEVGGFYRSADVFIFPTHSDGFGLTQLEAQAWRVPVIASRNCGQVVSDGVNGPILESVTPANIADALRHCCLHPEHLAQWSSASGVAPQFSLAAAGARLAELATGG